MGTLGWMQKIFKKNDQQRKNVSPRKACSCFSALWELDEQLYPAQVRQPTALEAHGQDIVNEEEMLECFHGFLAIGTFGSVIITELPITPKAAVDEEETSVGKNEVQFPNEKLENLTEKELEKDTKENKHMLLKEYYEMLAIKDDEKEQKTTPVNVFKQKATSHKRSGKGKLDKGVKKETHVFHLMKKMLKKLDFTSRRTATSGFRSNAIICDSTDKIPTKVVKKSKKIHPEAVDIQVNKSYKYDVKKMRYDESYDKEGTSDDEEKVYPRVGKKAHWIKTDADYFVLEF